jgi:hypothetical protein
MVRFSLSKPRRLSTVMGGILAGLLVAILIGMPASNMPTLNASTPTTPTDELKCGYEAERHCFVACLGVVGAEPSANPGAQYSSYNLEYVTHCNNTSETYKPCPPGTTTTGAAKCKVYGDIVRHIRQHFSTYNECLNYSVGLGKETVDKICAEVIQGDGACPSEITTRNKCVAPALVSQDSIPLKPEPILLPCIDCRQ